MDVASATGKNRHGLTRPIPLPVKRQVRRRDGFGCINCGSALYTYDHFDPEFQDAVAHTADGIWLLCSNCHLRKTKGLLSMQTLRAKLASPECKRQGFSWGAFDVGCAHPEVLFGSAEFIEAKTLLRVLDDDLFRSFPQKNPKVRFE